PPITPLVSTPPPVARSVRVEPMDRSTETDDRRQVVDPPTRPPLADAPREVADTRTAPPVATGAAPTRQTGAPGAPAPRSADGGTAALPAALTSSRTATFVGRSEELERLLDAWRRTRSGERRLVLLAGEPGIGKTQLAIELAAAAHADGATVLHGRCDDGLQVPYQPFAAALTQVLETAQAGSRRPAL